MTFDEQNKQIMDLVEQHARQIGEHVDSVQIFVTFQRDGGDVTSGYAYGTGNLYARLGQVRDWLLLQEEYTRVEARKRRSGDED